MPTKPGQGRSTKNRTTADCTAPAMTKTITITQCAFRKTSAVIQGGEFLQNQDVPSIVGQHRNGTLSVDQVWADDCSSFRSDQAKITQNQGKLESQPNDTAEHNDINDTGNTDSGSSIAPRLRHKFCY